MLTAISLLLSLFPPLPNIICSQPAWPDLQPPGLYDVAFPLPTRTACRLATKNVASLMYPAGIDPIAEVESGERADLDIYESDEP